MNNVDIKKELIEAKEYLKLSIIDIAQITGLNISGIINILNNNEAELNNLTDNGKKILIEILKLSNLYKKVFKDDTELIDIYLRGGNAYFGKYSSLEFMKLKPGENIFEVVAAHTRMLT